jgi:hypothetical protein
MPVAPDVRRARAADGHPNMNPPSRSEALPRLRHRPLQPGDIAECRELLPRWLGFDAATIDRVCELWSRLADHAAAAATGIVEDIAAPPGQRIRGWGVTLVMPPGWLEAFAPGGRFDDTRCANVSRDVYRGLLDGSIVLPDEREIGRQNAGNGIVFCALHYTQRQNDMSDAEALRVLGMAHEAFRMLHSGFRVRAVLVPSLLADEPWQTAGGLIRRSDPLPGPPETQTVLYALLRDEAERMMPGRTVRNVFDHQPPRFRLSASQRRLLWLSLFDLDDAQLMQRLDVSVHGLKKLWRGVYERVEDVQPDFFGDDAGSDDGRRGPEKRRQVLAYVRQRLEELRPWVGA